MTPIQQLHDKFSHQVVYYSCDYDKLEHQVRWCTHHLVRGTDWEFWMEFHTDESIALSMGMTHVFGFSQEQIALEFRLSF